MPSHQPDAHLVFLFVWTSLSRRQIKSSVFAAKSAHGAVYNVMAESSFAYL